MTTTETASKQLSDLGLLVITINDKELHFVFYGNIIRYYPYSQWYIGHGVGRGRGLSNLIKKLKGEE